MTENDIRKLVVTQAKHWEGTKEGSISHMTLIEIYNSINPLPVGYKLKDTDPWCAAFVSVVASACGLTDIIYPECSVPRMMAKYQEAGRWIEDDAYVPSPGDLIMYGWSDSGRGDYTGPPDHVGIVIACEDGMITAEEGNFRNAVQTRTLRVNGRYIRGFCVPDYASKATPDKIETIDDLIDEFTDEQAYRLLMKAQNYLSNKAVPDYALKEFSEAVSAGITDGTRPMQLTTRWQAALMAHRAKTK